MVLSQLRMAVDSEALPPMANILKCLRNLLQEIWSAISSDTGMIIAKEEGVPDATGCGTTAPRQLSPSPEHHQSPNYRTLAQRGHSRVSGPAGSVGSQSLKKTDAM